MRDRASPLLRDRIAKLSQFFDIAIPTIDAIAQRATSAEQFLDLFMAEVTHKQGKLRWAEKTPGNVANIARILGYWPQAHILHILRDPKDVFASLHAGGKSGGPAGFAKTWCDMVGKGRRDALALGIVGTRYMELRYEALVTEPERSMRAVLAFIDAPWEPQVAQFAGKQDEFDKVLAVTGKASTTLDRLREPLNQDKLGAWAKLVTPQEIAEVRREVAARGFGEMFAADELASERIWQRTSGTAGAAIQEVNRFSIVSGAVASTRAMRSPAAPSP
jgi:hypothetical protein